MNPSIPTCPKCGEEASGGAKFLRLLRRRARSALRRLARRAPSRGSAAGPIPAPGPLHGPLRRQRRNGRSPRRTPRGGGRQAAAAGRDARAAQLPRLHREGTARAGRRRAGRKGRSANSPRRCWSSPTPTASRFLRPCGCAIRQSDAEGIRCEAYAWDQTERIAARWDEVFLISCGRTRDRARRRSSRGIGLGGSRGRMTPLVMEKRHEFLIDMILFEPLAPAAARSEHRCVLADGDAARTGGHAGAALPLRVQPAPLRARRSDEPRRRAARRRRVGRRLGALTFLNKRDFETYTSWLVQLLRYGRPITA